MKPIILLAAFLSLSAPKAAEPWPRVEMMGRIDCESTPWAGQGQKRFRLITEQWQGWVKESEQLAFATRADYEAVEKLDQQVVEVTGILVCYGYSTILVVESVREQK